ncbi:MAG TPA: preprotein translocase subunit SecG [Saprospiraceae bacterium]|nr:preprotein translocase subunit SecG [Saprospiraceae bacterium]
MINFFTILSAVICVLLIGIILIQNPKGGGVDSTFGGGGANSIFGAARSIDLVEKLTWGLAIALFVICIVTAAIVAGSGAGEIQLQSAG